MVYVYVLKSEVNGDLYVGITENLERRIKQHEAGKNRYTKGLRPWKLCHEEIYPDYTEARKREVYLKSGVGKEFLKSLVP